ncbi:MAG: putative aminohydrolase SsnA [Gemmatimonadales bacterium]|nr:MAG: putative aminohydrolase SsnA [Gemmatimonadales bacterium]
MSTILGHGVVVTGGKDSRVIRDGAVAWRGDRIIAVGAEADLRRDLPEARFLDARGGTILPGLVNLHHHFYSALARGLDPRTPMADFSQILDRLWWRLDRALDPETVSLSARLSTAECVRWGCTTVFDHHASPSCIDGSLDLVAAAAEEAGISAVLCYEVTDRNGPAGAQAGIDENLRFLRERAGDQRIRGVFGLHASFTIRDETMAAIAQERPPGAGCHIHVAEDQLDVDASLSAFGRRPIQRLRDFGLLDERALLAHGIHLEAREYEEIAAAGATIIHNPESNANNAVGRLDVPRASGLGCHIGLGTDGMSSAVLRALRFAFLMQRGASSDPTTGFEHIPRLLETNVPTARRFFDEPLLGELAPDAPADIIVVDATPPTPLSAENTFGHLIYGISESPVRHTIARGRVVYQEFEHTTMDPRVIADAGRAAAPALWERFHALDWGTPYLGEAT